MFLCNDQHNIIYNTPTYKNISSKPGISFSVFAVEFLPLLLVGGGVGGDGGGEVLPPPSRSPCLRSSDYFSNIVLPIVLFNSWDILDVDVDADVDADADVDVNIVLFCCVLMILCEPFCLMIDNNNNNNTV